MKRFAIIFLSFATALMPLGSIRAATISPGDLIKASGPAVYYYHSDGTRLVFPNEKTYFTWYNDFSNVKTITDDELAQITIGGNVTYRPGVKLVKVTTDPKVYAIGAERMLRWVQTEEVATALYGANWASQVNDIPDAFFIDYELGTPITSAADYNRTAVQDAAPTVADTRPSVSGTETEIANLETTVGEMFTITLDTNISTGYAWEADYDVSFLEFISSSTSEPETGLVGAAGSQSFTFHALKEGVTNLTMNERRSWEEGVDPIRRRIYTVTILPAAQPEDTVVTLTASKTEAQANEIIDLIAQADYSGPVESLDILLNGALYQSCAGSKFCALSWTVPLAGTTSVYTVVARLQTANGETHEASTDITIVDLQMHPSIRLVLEHETLKLGQEAGIEVQMEAGLNARRIEIVIDGQAVKSCLSNPTTCRYDGYVNGELGSTHEVYAKVETPSRLWYRSEAGTITLAENDSPRITVTVGQDVIPPTATIDVTVAADDDDGIAYTELLQNGEVIKHCAGAAPCTAIVGPFDLPSGSVVTFDAKAEDLKGLSRTVTEAASLTIN